MNFIKKNLFTIIGLATGAAAGFLYWKYIGCMSGSCAITSNPLNSTIYGSVVGGILFSTFKSKNKTC